MDGQDVTEPLGAFGQDLPGLPFIDDKGRPNGLIQQDIEDVGVVDPRSHHRVSEGEDAIDDRFDVHAKGLEVADREHAQPDRNLHFPLEAGRDFDNDLVRVLAEDRARYGVREPHFQLARQGLGPLRVS